eukprot:6194580-Pleurochrysis_carterae.AAC.1
MLWWRRQRQRDEVKGCSARFCFVGQGFALDDPSPIASRVRQQSAEVRREGRHDRGICGGKETYEHMCTQSSSASMALGLPARHDGRRPVCASTLNRA